MSHPQQIHPSPREAAGIDETSAKATISVTRPIAGSLYGGGAGAVKDSQPIPVSITDTVPEPWREHPDEPPVTQTSRIVRRGTWAGEVRG